MVTQAFSNTIGTSIYNSLESSLSLIRIYANTRSKLFCQIEMKPLRIKLVNQLMVLVPQEHTSAVTQKGTLKSEVRTSPVMHQSDTRSSLVQGYQCNLPPSHFSLLSSSPSLCHSEGSWKSKHGYSSFWVQNIDIQNNSIQEQYQLNQSSFHT